MDTTHLPSSPLWCAGSQDQILMRPSRDASTHAARSGKPYLGDTNVVSGLVRAFLAGVVNRLAQVGTGTLDRGAAAAADRAECVRLSSIFLGRDPAYEPGGQWNDGT